MRLFEEKADPNWILFFGRLNPPSTKTQNAILCDICDSAFFFCYVKIFGRVFSQQAGCLFPIDLQIPGDQWFNPESATKINEGVGRYGSENRRPFNLMQYSIQIGKDMSENESDSMVFQSDSSQGIPVRFTIFIHVWDTSGGFLKWGYPQSSSIL